MGLSWRSASAWRSLPTRPASAGARGARRCPMAWEAAVQGAERWCDRAAQEAEAAAAVAYAAARPLLEAPDLLARIGQTMQARGYAGDPAPAVLAYLALTSRLLPRPVNLALVAQS